MDSFTMSRNWFNFSFENPEMITPGHSAIYFFAIEHCNRLGSKEKFGFPTTMAMEAVGIKSYNTYIKLFNDLVEWGFIKLIEKSKNQYSSNIIALSKNNKAFNKALDKALIKHCLEQELKQDESIDSINKQSNNQTIKQGNILHSKSNEEKFDYIENVIKVFSDKFFEIRGVNYEIVNKGKERSCAAKILKIYKKKYPDSDSKNTLDSLSVYFESCLRITDNWLNQNMGLPLIINKFNEINNIIKNGNKRTKNGNGATPEELAEITARHFATDRK